MEYHSRNGGKSNAATTMAGKKLIDGRHIGDKRKLIDFAFQLRVDFNSFCWIYCTECKKKLYNTTQLAVNMPSI
jgi:hypothetical protein